MTGVAIFLFFAAGIYLASRISVAQARSPRAQDPSARALWSEAARALGLRMEPAGSLFKPLHIVGDLERLEVEAWHGGGSLEDGAGGRTTIVITHPVMDPKLELSREDLPGRIETGDTLFDHAVNVRGPAATVFALLDSETRAFIQRQFGGEVTVKERQVRYEALDHPSDLPLARRIRLLLELAQRLEIPSQRIVDRLAWNAENDPDLECRMKNLATLGEFFPTLPVTQRAANASLAAPQVPLRLVAASLVQSDASRRALEEILADELTAADLRGQALGALVNDFPWAEVAPAIRRALTCGAPNVQAAAFPRSVF